MSIFFLGLQKQLLSLHSNFEKRANREDDPVKIGIIKQAFDTRRINSEEQINPRRNLQNYQRSEPFISEEIALKIKSLFKVKNAVDQIKGQFIGDPDWLDSNSRILCNAIDNTLRIDQKDYDFFKPQFDYLDELLYLRYRLASGDIDRLREDEIKDTILKRDEKLLYKSIYSNYLPTDRIHKSSDQSLPMVKQTIISQEDSLMEKLFGNVKASKDSKSVERSVNIVIKDSILEKDIEKDTEKKEE